jgi:hypothetical protein
MEGLDVIVLEVNLDEGFPVVVALVHLNVIEFEAREVKGGARAHAGQIGGHIAAIAFKEQAIPFLEWVVLKVQARVLGKVWGTQQVARRCISPTVKWANNVATRAAFLLGMK